MNQFGFLEYVILSAAFAIWWRLHLGAHPPPGAEAPASPPAPPAGTAAPPRSGLQPAPADAAAPLGRILGRICLASRYADISPFLDGAKGAYEAIVRGFTEGDMAPLADLLSTSVRQDFEAAIATRKANGERIEMTFIGFRACEVADAGIAGGTASITVRFVGEMVSVTRDRDGRVVAGDPGRLVDIAELWTFEREMRSATPSWLLVATEGAP